MPKFVPLSPTRHRTLRLKPHAGYGFAATEALVPLVLAELPAAAIHLPVVLAPLGDAYRPAALLGLTAGHSLHVLRDGSWRGNYIPAAIRAYPFTPTLDAEGNAIVLADEDSGLFSEDAALPPLFDDNGAPTPYFSPRLDFLRNLAAEHRSAAHACAVLQRHGLVVPWTAAVKLPDGERKVHGLFQIDEAKFAACSPEVLAELRDAGALLLVYALRFSRPNLQNLANLASVPLDPAPPTSPARPTRELDPALAAVSAGGTLRLSGL